MKLRAIFKRTSSDANRRRFLRKLGLFGGLGLTGAGTAAVAEPVYSARSADPFIAEIIMFAGNFAPRGWAFCEGQLLAISNNQALFSLLGTIYGGDGRTTFALPDLRGRAPIHPGPGPGLSTRRLGEKGGQEQVTLSGAQMAAHTHVVSANSSEGSSDDPTGKVSAKPASGIPQYADTSDGEMSPTGSTGTGLAHNNMPPFMAINYIIALNGVYPSRN